VARNKLGEEDHDGEQNEITKTRGRSGLEPQIHPIQLERTPDVFQLATLPPTWTCMVDI